MGKKKGLEGRIFLAYGQRIACDWPLRLPPAPPGSVTCSIVRAPASRFARSRASVPADRRNDWLQHILLEDGSNYLCWKDLFEFQVSADGRRIDARPLHRTSRAAFETYLLGQVMSFALLRRGLEQLHATTVVVDGGAVAFLGHSGYGKSSLGAAFLQAGYNLLTDDMLVLRRSSHGFDAHPGPPRIKMFPAMARRILRRQGTGVHMNPRTRKLIIPLASSRQPAEKISLRALYILNPPAAGGSGKRVVIRSMPERKALLALLANTFNTVDTDPARLRRQFNFVADLCRTVPVRALSYPRKVRFMPQVREAILANLRRLD